MYLVHNQIKHSSRVPVAKGWRRRTPHTPWRARPRARARKHTRRARAVDDDQMGREAQVLCARVSPRGTTGGLARPGDRNSTTRLLTHK